MAPEVFTGSYSEKCDIWSCGVLMYKLLSTRFPFEGEDEVTLRQKLTVGEFDLTSSEWSSVKPDLKDLLKGMLQTNPDKRLTADEAVNHAFFKRKPTDALVIDIDKSKMKKKQLEEVESGAIIKGALTNFLQFSAKSKAKISIYSYFTSELLSKAELNIITSVFKELDKDGDGVLKYRELMDSYKKYAPELAGEFEQKGNGLLKMVNLGCRRPGNLDDYVSYSRFIMAAMNYTVLINKEKVDNAYRLFDEDEDGGVSQDELKYILNFLDIMSDDEIAELLQMGDVSGDKEMSKNEFYDLMVRFEKE